MPAEPARRRPQRRPGPWTSIATALRRRMARRDERGDAYSTVIMVAIGVVLSVAVGGILIDKFTDKANSIDTDTPAVTIPQY